MQLHADLVTIPFEQYKQANMEEAELYEVITRIINRAFQDGMEGRCYLCNGFDENHRGGCVMNDIVEVARQVQWIPEKKGSKS